jgi:hypothetical protein
MRKPRYAADYRALLALCRERGVAVQTIKAIARRPWADRPRTHNTYFYQPLETQEAIDRAVHWSLGEPDTFLITAGDMQVLPMVLDAASRFEGRPSDAEMSAMVEELGIQPIFS